MAHNSTHPTQLFLQEVLCGSTDVYCVSTLQGYAFPSKSALALEAIFRCVRELLDVLNAHLDPHHRRSKVFFYFAFPREHAFSQKNTKIKKLKLRDLLWFPEAIHCLFTNILGETATKQCSRMLFTGGSILTFGRVGAVPR